MSAVPKLVVFTGAAGDIEGGVPPLVPPGQYQLALENWSTVMLFGRAPKLVLQFKICDFGPHFELKLPRWYNVKKLKGKVGRNGRFTVGWSSDLVRDYARLIGMPARMDRINLDALRGLVAIGMVETVTRDRSQSVLPACCQYSVVRAMVGIA